ncbi:hypothetical protein SDC9_140707 [bioreactor metagenome]|uniref:Uncharacterized protein n=1 Tax=bioreactor metagenome TaxID=1076179 RepID=A0A645DWR6_9ZZZZ
MGSAYLMLDAAPEEAEPPSAAIGTGVTGAAADWTAAGTAEGAPPSIFWPHSLQKRWPEPMAAPQVGQTESTAGLAYVRTELRLVF